MKKKKLALLLAAAMTVTSIDSTAMMVNAADFASEEVQEQSVEFADEDPADEESPEVTVDTDAEGEDGGAFSDDSSADESIEIAEEPEESVDIEGEDDAIDIQEEEEVSADDVFGAEGEIAVQTEDEETPDVTELKLDTVYTADIDEEGQRLWYSFTPTQDGKYVIYSEGEFDTYAELYENIDDEWPLQTNNDSGEGSNFKLSYTLEADQTYYYCVSMDSSDDTGSFTVQIEKAPEIKSIEASNVLTEGIANMPFYIYADLKLTYTNDISEETAIRYTDSYAYVDSDTISTVLTDAADGSSHSLGESLEAGTYTLKFVWNNVESAEYSVNIVEKPENSSLYMGSLNLNEETNVQTPRKGCAFYSFTAPADGTYFIPDSDSEYAVYRQEQYSDNMASSWSMEKGETVYICLYGGERYTEGSESVSIRVRQKCAVTSMTYTKEDINLTEGLNHINKYNQFPGVLAVTYSDGMVDEFRPSWNNWEWISQGEAYLFSKLYIVNEDNSETAFTWEEEDNVSLPAGRYKMQFGMKENQDADPQVTAETTFEVKKLEYTDLPKLTKDTNNIEVSENRYKWYGFTPWKTGEYNFEWKFLKDSSDGFGKVWYKLEDGQLISIDDSYDLENGYESMEADDQYVIGIMSSADNPVTLELTKNPVPEKGLENLSYSPYPMTFTAGIDDIGFDKFKGTILYDDGTKKSVSWGYTEYDEDYELSFRLVRSNSDGEDETVDQSEIVPGNYKYNIYYSYVLVDSIPVTVVEPKAAENIEADKTATVENNSSTMILEFKPETSGRYEFNFNINISDAKLVTRDEEGRYCSEYHWYNVNKGYATLEAGTTYYLGISAADRYQEIQVTPKLLAYPVEVTTKVNGERSYIEAIDSFPEDDLETTITYSDGTTKKVINGMTFDGYEVGYEGRIKDTEEYYRYSGGSYLAPGVWEIRPYLTEGDEEEYSLDGQDSVSPAINGVEITVDSLKDRMDEFTPLVKDTETQVNATNRAMYRFTADKEETYELTSKGDLRGTIYTYYVNEDEEEGYWRGEDFIEGIPESIELSEGETCVIKIRAYNDSVVKISEQSDPEPDPDDKPVSGDTTADFELQVGNPTDVRIAKEGDVVSATFKPEQDGYYRLRISNISGSVEDTDYGVKTTLYCGEERLEETESSVLLQKLEKNKTYTYKFEFLDTDVDINATGSFKVSLSSVVFKKIRNIELVLKSGSKAENCTIFDDLMSFYDVKVTYADGTSEVYDEPWGSDEYGNSWDMYDVQDEKTAYDSNEILHQIHFEYTGREDDGWQQTKTQTISARAFASLDTLKTNTQVNPFKNGETGKYYRFTPTETGTYLFTSSIIEGRHAYVSIYSIDGAYSGENKKWNIKWEDIEHENNGSGGISVYLTANKTYLVNAEWYYEDRDGSASVLQVKRIKTLKSIEVINPPDQRAVFPGANSRVSLKGMVIRANYIDGESEEVAYGGTDSQGMSFYYYGDEVEWINDTKCRVTVDMGGYKTNVEFDAANWDDVPALKLDTKEKLEILYTNQAYCRFIPEESGYYSFNVTDGYAEVYDSRTEAMQLVQRAYLEKGVAYHISVSVRGSAPTIEVVAGACQWVVEEQIDATCTTDGKIVERCKTHHDTRTTINRAYGHNWSSWKITKAATCADGEEQHTCSICKTVEKRAVKATKAHNFSAWKVTKKATVLATGTQERKCGVCGKTETASVKKLPATIALNVKGTIPLKVKQTFTVKVTTGAGDKVKSWKSSNSKFVSVKNGKIKGLKAGKTATITVQLASGKKASFKVKVQKAAVTTKSIKVTNAVTGKNQGKSATLKRGQTLKLATVLTPVTSTDKVTWSTSNKKIATVSKAGVIKGVKKGKATITVKSGNKKYNIKITVK